MHRHLTAVNRWWTMPLVSVDAPITLKEIQLRLGVPQHVLIHLCEKGVIEPDFAETSGRGKRREFSDRNVFEFAVALALRRFELPVATTALVIRILRSSTRAISKAAPAFELPGSLVQGNVALALFFYDGNSLVLSARGSALRQPLILRSKVPQSANNDKPTVRVEKLSELPAAFEVRLEIDLAAIAKNALKKHLSI